MEKRPTPATIHLGMLIQHSDQWVHTGGGDTRRGPAGRSFGGRAARAAADLGRGSAARPARPGPGPRPERPPSLLQPWRPAGEPWRLSAPGHPAGPAGTPRPALPALNLRPRPCRCPCRRRYRAPGACARVRSPQRWRRGCTNFGPPGAGRRSVSAGPRGPAASRRAGPGAGPGAGRADHSWFGGAERIWVGAGGSGPLPLLSTPRPQGPAVGGGLAGLQFSPPQEPEPRAPGTWAGAAAGPLTPAAHIPLPAHRAPQGKAQLDEVMAAAALTSLSTSPLLLEPPTAGFHSEPRLEPWSEPPVQPPGSHSSSGGDWGWDPASELSSPPTPSPPLSLEAAHFLFGEPAPRKRKGAVQVLFQCLWKRCGEVLSTASGMQRHIRLAHLGRQAEPEQSDGEEDFYYTELDIGLEVLTGGLSSLASMSPTASLPPGFPHLELREPPALPSLLRPLALPPPQVLSSVAHPQVCRSDHSYQGCLAPARLQVQPSPAGAREPAPPSTSGAGLRKPRGDAKKCRKAFGVQRRDLWCTACRWKKACQRFLGTAGCPGRPSSQRRK